MTLGSPPRSQKLASLYVYYVHAMPVLYDRAHPFSSSLGIMVHPIACFRTCPQHVWGQSVILFSRLVIVICLFALPLSPPLYLSPSPPFLSCVHDTTLFQWKGVRINLNNGSGPSQHIQSRCPQPWSQAAVTLEQLVYIVHSLGQEFASQRKWLALQWTALTRSTELARQNLYYFIIPNKEDLRISNY